MNSTVNSWGYNSEFPNCYKLDKLNYRLDRTNGVGTTAGYESMSTQLDQLYHDMKDGKLGVAATTGSWYVGVTSVKTAFPKPS